MDDEDRADTAEGGEDALRHDRPGGARKTRGEAGPADRSGRQGGAPAQARPDNPGGVAGTEGSRGTDDRAAGSIDDPIRPGDGIGTNDFQPGDRGELARQRGGPVDISRDRPRKR